jgi:hypothetical protein
LGRSLLGQKGADWGTKLVAELLHVYGCLILAFSSVCRVIGPTVGWGKITLSVSRRK